MSNTFGDIDIFLGTDHTINFTLTDTNNALVTDSTMVFTLKDRQGASTGISITATTTGNGIYTIAIPYNISLSVGSYDGYATFTSSANKISTYEGNVDVSYAQMGV